MFLNLVESKAGVGTWSFDACTQTILLSSRARMMFGLDDASSPTPSLATALSLVHTSDRETILSAVGLLRSGINQIFEFRLLGEGSDIRWISVVATASLTQTGALECVFGFVQDITELRRSLKAVEDSERRTRQVADAHGLKSWVAINAIGLNSDDLGSSMEQVTHHFIDHLHPDDLSVAHDSMLEAKRETKPVVLNVRLMTKTNTSVPTKIYLTPIKDRSGTFTEWHGASVIVQRDSLEALPLTSIEGCHLRAARGLLNWPLGELAAKAKVSMSTIRRAEESGLASIGSRSGNAIQDALNAGGASFSRVGEADIAVIDMRRS